jgi:hypothetical protein
MKIVGFEANGGLHLGVVEGDQVIDLQAVDKSIPSDLGECLRRNNGDLSALKDAAKRAPAIAHRPLKGLKYALPVTTPGKVICLGLNYLDHVKEGSQRDNIPKFPTIFMRGNSRFVCTVSRSSGQKVSRNPTTGRARLHRQQAGQAPRRECIFLHCKVFLRQQVGARISAQNAMDMAKFDRTGGRSLMVTADEVPAGGKGLKIGPDQRQVVPSDNTDNMMRRSPDHRLSPSITLEPGMSSSRPSGSAMRKPGPMDEAGDTCEIDIEGAACEPDREREVAPYSLLYGGRAASRAPAQCRVMPIPVRPG